MSEKIGRDKRFVPRMQYDVKALWEKHHEIARQVVLGRTNVAIAESIGCTPQTVSNVRNSPLAKARIESLNDSRDADAISMAQRIEEFAPIALKLLENIVSGNVPEASIALRAKYASAHLGRAGYGEVHKMHALHAHVTGAEIERIKERALNAARENGMVVEVESHEVFRAEGTGS
jgi:hypothetical protein